MIRKFRTFLNETDKIFTNLGGNTLKHVTKNSPSKTLKFYISSSSPDAGMYAGDSYSHTHHSLGAKGSQLWGGITHHTDDDSYHYAAHKYDSGNYPEASHERLNRLEAHGFKRGKWNSDTNRVDKT